MFGNVTALVGLHVTGKCRVKSMTHTCSRHAAWDPHGRVWRGVSNVEGVVWSASSFVVWCGV